VPARPGVYAWYFDEPPPGSALVAPARSRRGFNPVDD